MRETAAAGGARPQAVAPTLLFLCGQSDSGQELIELGADGNLTAVYLGSCSFLPLLTPGRFRIEQAWLGGKLERELPRLRSLPMVNYIADADSHSRALGMAADIVEQAGNPPCFNPPHLVARTRRDMIAATLTGIPGLRVPRTIRIEARRPGEFQRAAAEHALSFPLIVRLAGDHNGISTVKVEGPEQWDPIYTLPWQGSAVYLTEFADCRDADGLYRKHRIVMVDGKPFLLHVCISKQWMVHRKAHLAERNDEEAQRLKSFEQDLLPRIAPVLSEIHRRIGLDYYGLDFHVGADGTMTLFEANAAMNINNAPYSLPHRNGPQARVLKAVESKLQQFARNS